MDDNAVRAQRVESIRDLENQITALAGHLNVTVWQ
jgi:hypothetical protein